MRFNLWFKELNYEYNNARDIIASANKVSLLDIFNYYGIKIDEINCKITCPIPSHKSGRESTASFLFYPETNSFHCFGCKAGARAVNFVAAMDKTNNFTAAKKILTLFNSNFAVEFDEDNNFIDIFDLECEFATMIREFRQYHFDEHSFKFIENICYTFDKLMSKHKLGIEAIQSILNSLKKEILKYDSNNHSG